MNYKRLGDYIELSNSRNSQLKYGERDVRGVSNNKKIIGTKANNNGRSFDKFYIVGPSAFIYNSRTSRMGDKVGLGFNETKKTIITSFNNTVFRVKNEFLIPKYLFMWFNRAEFDRYARFNSWGSSTEIFSWEDMQEVKLPIPSIEKQQQIVAEYNTVTNRIQLNEKINTNLEATAQALYKHWFVDFEFPNQEGKPYKTSGGKMVYNEELDKEIPVGWSVERLSEITKITMGQSPSGKSYNEDGIGKIFYQGRTDFGFRLPSIRTYTTESKRMAEKGDILISVRAPVGDLNIASSNCCIGRGLASIRSNETSYTFYLMKDFKSLFDSNKGTGTIFSSINKDELFDLKVVYNKEKAIEFNRIVNNIDGLIYKNCEEIVNLKELQSLLLAKMTQAAPKPQVV